MLELVCFLWNRKSRFEFWWGQEVGIILFLHHEKSKSTLEEFLRCWKGPLLPLFKSAPQEGLKITKLTEGLYSAYANYYLHWKDLWKHVSFWVGFCEIVFFFSVSATQSPNSSLMVILCWCGFSLKNLKSKKTSV